MKTLVPFLACSMMLTMIDACAQDDGEVGGKAPDFSLELLGGGTFTLSDHSGKVVFIFLFGYDCPHCKANGPNTQSDIYEVYKEDTSFVAVGVDTWDGTESGVENFRAVTNITYPLCLNGSSLEQLYNTTYDRIVVVDQDGIIRYKSTSNATSGVVSEASDVIASHLGTGGGTVTALREPVTKADDVKLYPVPARDQLTIESPYIERTGFNIKIYNLTGEIILEKNAVSGPSGRISIPIRQQPSGMYFIRLSAAQRTLTGRFLIGK